jgi:hypothetical protein
MDMYTPAAILPPANSVLDRNGSIYRHPGQRANGGRQRRHAARNAIARLWPREEVRIFSYQKNAAASDAAARARGGRTPPARPRIGEVPSRPPCHRHRPATPDGIDPAVPHASADARRSRPLSCPPGLPDDETTNGERMAPSSRSLSWPLTGGCTHDTDTRVPAPRTRKLNFKPQLRSASDVALQRSDQFRIKKQTRLRVSKRERERERARMIEIGQDGTGRIHVSNNVIRRLLHFHGARVSCAGRLYVFLDGYKKHLHFVPPPSFQSGPELCPPRTAEIFVLSMCGGVALEMVCTSLVVLDKDGAFWSCYNS